MPIDPPDDVLSLAPEESSQDGATGEGLNTVSDAEPADPKKDKTTDPLSLAPEEHRPDDSAGSSSK